MLWVQLLPIVLGQAIKFVSFPAHPSWLKNIGPVPCPYIDEVTATAPAKIEVHSDQD